ncbi:peptidoglycan meso-diaminopimelic acid protein amidase [Serratia sp. DD3]|uniref:peptidoglycan meso-diaminopimelic acid protein amidase n=1 Tax=Serratia sp. DD3 TaxID=1410619 RepID=UPI0003C52C4C|nr:peptidoglycan meso-diaminopimelic acid protein amidase [Serratia sp. DD3]KEY60650.1 L,D-transpeptidase catalytic domain [Serratia sp. DD3]
MSKIALLFAMLFCMPIITACSASEQAPPQEPVVKQKTLGSPVYIQIFKEERRLELYTQVGNEFRLMNSFPICNFSGGLGPKRREGDLKSPEGFYNITARNLKPNSKFYRAINIGFPNDYDKAQGYSGAYLMIHGECKSIGCYAMTNTYMDEIYRYVDAAFAYGQGQVNINIYPFRMTEENLQRHRSSDHIAFWRQLKPGYDYFVKHHRPPAVNVSNGQYALVQPITGNAQPTQYASTTNTDPTTQGNPFTVIK